MTWLLQGFYGFWTGIDRVGWSGADRVGSWGWREILVGYFWNWSVTIRLRTINDLGVGLTGSRSRIRRIRLDEDRFFSMQVLHSHLSLMATVQLLQYLSHNIIITHRLIRSEWIQLLLCLAIIQLPEPDFVENEDWISRPLYMIFWAYEASDLHWRSHIVSSHIHPPWFLRRLENSVTILLKIKKVNKKV
jgi:hypothetical protein